MFKDGHTHKCPECGKEYKHYSQDDNKCKEPEASTCGVCCRVLDIKKDKKK